MEKEILLSSVGLRVSAQTKFPQYVTVERADAGRIRILPGELRSLVAALCSSAALLAESVAGEGSIDGES